MQFIFNQLGDAIGEQMLGPLEEINKEVSAWLGTPQGRKDVEAIADAFVEGAKGVRDMAKFLGEVKGFLDSITSFNMDWVGALRDFRNSVLGTVTGGGGNNATGDGSGRGSTPFGGTSRMGNKSVTVNINTPIDSVLVVGDEIDFQTISRWSENTPLAYEQTIHADRELTKEILWDLSEYSKECIIQRSNHTDRLYNTLLKVPGLISLPELQYPKFMGFAEMGMTYSKQPYQIPGTKAQLGQIKVRQIAFLLQCCLNGRLYTGL